MTVTREDSWYIVDPYFYTWVVSGAALVESITYTQAVVHRAVQSFGKFMEEVATRVNNNTAHVKRALELAKRKGR